MNRLDSINQFLTAIGCRFECYDMGRLIQPIEQQTFIDFESSSIPWNSPFLQHAWLALVFWQEQGWKPQGKNASMTDAKQDHMIWFLKLPLDEQAKLNLAARDDFLHRLFKTLENDSVAKNQQEKHHLLENAIQDSPYGFQPKQEQMANFHAIAHKHLGLPASQYYQNVQRYFSDPDGFEQWNQLGFQGFADLAARLDEKFQDKNNQELIAQAIATLPLPPFQALANCLENHVVSSQLTRAVLNRLIREQELELEKNDNEQLSIIPVYIASIRATAQACNQKLQAQLLSQILKSPGSSNIEVLAVISGRCWQQLFQPQILTFFLEALARSESNPNQSESLSQGAFNAIMSDIMFIPGMRNAVLQSFRSPDRSEQLAKAIGAFLNLIKSG